MLGVAPTNASTISAYLVSKNLNSAIFSPLAPQSSEVSNTHKISMLGQQPGPESYSAKRERLFTMRQSIVASETNINSLHKPNYSGNQIYGI